MQGTDADEKNIGLAKLIYRLRQDLDLYRIIGLNQKELTEKGVSVALWGHLQMMAHESIAVTICKIFEKEDRYPRNSMPGIIEELCGKTSHDGRTVLLQKFAEKYGVNADILEEAQLLAAVVADFRQKHTVALARLKYFRDKIGAHSEHGIVVDALPSLDECEQSFEFAVDFYRVVSAVYIDVIPAFIGSHVGDGLVRVMEALGIESPAVKFPDE